MHLYFESFQTPKGAVRPRPGDPGSLEIEPIRFDEPFAKYSFVKRRAQEIRYGKMAARRIHEYRPDLILSSNTPLDAQHVVQRTAERLGSKFVFWLQDIYSIAIDSLLKKKRLPYAPFVGAWYKKLERGLLRSSDAVVAISPDFTNTLEQWGVSPRRIHVIQNWAPRNELLPHTRDNSWAREHDLAGRFVFLYSGTIGLKHNPALLVDLAAAMRDDESVAVVVISDGVNADWIREQARSRGLDNLRVLPLQPYERMPEVLASGDVLLALLGESSGQFSVPSKVLTYMCAGRALLLSVPEENLAARIVAGNHAGLVAPPEDSAAFVDAARQLRGNYGFRERCASNSLRYADETFDISAIATRFEQVFETTGLPLTWTRTQYAGIQ